MTAVPNPLELMNFKTPFMLIRVERSKDELSPAFENVATYLSF